MRLDKTKTRNELVQRQYHEFVDPDGRYCLDLVVSPRLTIESALPQSYMQLTVIPSKGPVEYYTLRTSDISLESPDLVEHWIIDPETGKAEQCTDRKSLDLFLEKMEAMQGSRKGQRIALRQAS